MTKFTSSKGTKSKPKVISHKAKGPTYRQARGKTSSDISKENKASDKRQGFNRSTGMPSRKK